MIRFCNLVIFDLCSLFRASLFGQAELMNRGYSIINESSKDESRKQKIGGSKDGENCAI